MKVQRRIQTQTLNGDVDRIVTVFIPRPTPAREARIRGSWYTADSPMEANTGLDQMHALIMECLWARVDVLPALDERKGQNVLFAVGAARRAVSKSV